MTAITVSQILTLYTWFPLALLLLFLLLIARHYQRSTGETTRFLWFLAPLLLFGLAVVRYSSIDHVSGDILANGLLGGGGLILLGASLYLYRRMSRHR